MASRPARIPAVRRGYLVAVVVTTGSAVKADLAYLAHAVRLGRGRQPFQRTDYGLGGGAAGGPHQRPGPPGPRLPLVPRRPGRAGEGRGDDRRLGLKGWGRRRCAHGWQ